MRAWTQQELKWTADLPGGRSPSVLFGLPAYDDAGVGYHDPDVENLAHRLRGIHAGLASQLPLPDHYQGVALYSDWEMTEPEWDQLRTHFLSPG